MPEDKKQLIEQLFKNIYGTLIDSKYTELSKEEIISVAQKTIKLFNEKF